MKQFIPILALILLLTGCATIKPAIKTPTGKPEIVINNVSTKQIRNTIINDIASSGFYLQQTDEFRLVFGRKYMNLGSFLLIGSEPNPFPETRYQFTVIEDSSAVKIFVNIYDITNPGTPSEVATEVSRDRNLAMDMQIYLTMLKNKFETGADYNVQGKVGIIFKGNKIVRVIYQSPAERYGLKSGDIMLQIDGKPITKDYITDSINISGKPYTEAVFVILRDGKEMTISIRRE